MKSVSVSRLKASLSQYLAAVKAGEEVVVTERGRSIAKLVPLPPALDDMARLRAMERQGRVRLPKQWPTKESLEEFWAMPMPEDPEGLVLKAVLEEREEGW